MTPSSGIEPGPHRWEVSALTTAPSLLSLIIVVISYHPSANLFKFQFACDDNDGVGHYNDDDNGDCHGRGSRDGDDVVKW